MRKQNEHEIIEGICYVKTSNGKQFIIDEQDYDLIKDYTWYITRTGYVITKNKHFSSLLHRLLLGKQCDNLDVDHINGDKLDNRRCNLRPSTRSLNIFNRPYKPPEKTGIRSINLLPSGRYTASVCGKYLGSFDSIDEAVKEVEEEEMRVFGETSRHREVTTKIGEPRIKIGSSLLFE